MREGILVSDKRGGKSAGVVFESLEIDALFECDGKIFWKSACEHAHWIRAGTGIVRWADVAFKNLKCVIRPDLTLTLVLEHRDET